MHHQHVILFHTNEQRSGISASLSRIIDKPRVGKYFVPIIKSLFIKRIENIVANYDKILTFIGLEVINIQLCASLKPQVSDNLENSQGSMGVIKSL